MAAPALLGPLAPPASNPNVDPPTLATVGWLCNLQPGPDGGRLGPLALDAGERGRRPRRFSTPYDRRRPRYLSASDDSYTADGEALDVSRPDFSFTCLIGLAVLSSDAKRLSVGQIYEYITRNFPFYRTAKGTWRNSVRHVLSLNKFFRKPPVADGQTIPPTKGGVWEAAPLMLPTLLEHIAEGQQRLSASTCRHLGLPQLKKRIIKSKIGRGRAPWSAVARAAPKPPPAPPAPPLASAVVAATAAAVAASPPAAPPAGSRVPLELQFDLDEQQTLAELQASIGVDDCDALFVASPADVSLSSSSSWPGSPVPLTHSIDRARFSSSSPQVPELEPEWAPATEDDLLIEVFRNLDHDIINPARKNSGSPMKHKHAVF